MHSAISPRPVDAQCNLTEISRCKCYLIEIRRSECYLTKISGVTQCYLTAISAISLRFVLSHRDQEMHPSIQWLWPLLAGGAMPTRPAGSVSDNLQIQIQVQTQKYRYRYRYAFKHRYKYKYKYRCKNKYKLQYQIQIRIHVQNGMGAIWSRLGGGSLRWMALQVDVRWITDQCTGGSIGSLISAVVDPLDHWGTICSRCSFDISTNQSLWLAAIIIVIIITTKFINYS